MLRAQLLVSLLMLLVSACSRPAPPAPNSRPPLAQSEVAAPVVPPPRAADQRDRGLPVGIDWQEAAPQGDVAGQVRQAWHQAQRDRRTLLVYVGAAWCEPCQLFHDTVKTGRLDVQLAGLRLLAYDFDRDKDRLALAGYTSDMLPLFAGSAPDGMASQRKLGGAVKGNEAIAFIMPRLTRMMNGQRRFDQRVADGLGNPPLSPLPIQATAPVVR